MAASSAVGGTSSTIAPTATPSAPSVVSTTHGHKLFVRDAAAQPTVDMGAELTSGGSSSHLSSPHRP